MTIYTIFVGGPMHGKRYVHHNELDNYVTVQYLPLQKASFDSSLSKHSLSAAPEKILYHLHNLPDAYWVSHGPEFFFGRDGLSEDVLLELLPSALEMSAPKPVTPPPSEPLKLQNGLYIVQNDIPTFWEMTDAQRAGIEHWASTSLGAGKAVK